MVAIYGTRLYGASLYSADVTFLHPAMLVSSSAVSFRAGVRIVANFAAIVSSSAMTATGRLMWTPIDVAPCTGWASLVRNPCCVGGCNT